MNSVLKTKDLVISALLIAIGILIPMIFTMFPFRIIVGPYSATLMAHVPVIIAMFISPAAAVFTAVGTTVGFFFTADTVVAVRAASHIVFAVIGVYMIRNRCSLSLTCVSTGVVHGALEGLVVLAFFAFGSANASGYSNLAMMWITIVGTFVHHIVDFIIAVVVSKALIRAKMLPELPPVFKIIKNGK